MPQLVLPFFYIGFVASISANSFHNALLVGLSIVIIVAGTFVTFWYMGRQFLLRIKVVKKKKQVFTTYSFRACAIYQSIIIIGLERFDFSDIRLLNMSIGVGRPTLLGRAKQIA